MIVSDELTLFKAEIKALLASAQGTKPSPATAAMDVRYVSTKHAATVTGVCSETIRNWVKQGRLQRYTAGRQLRIDLSELHALLRGRQNDGLEFDTRARTKEILANV